ncbi:hypothetical protein NO135_26635, partial [Clostridioides difficile]|nr:hypothetical protein [Clostridioides difficile]
RYDATTGSAKPKIHSRGLMADYNLSKRTDVYAQAVYQRGAKGNVIGTSIYNGDNSTAPSSSINQTAAT